MCHIFPQTKQTRKNLLLWQRAPRNFFIIKRLQKGQVYYLKDTEKYFG